MKKASLLLMVLGVLIFVSCARKETPMTILTEDYPPLSYLENGVVTGYGADVVAAIQAELQTKAVPELMNWDAAYKRALTEPNVVLFTMEKTPEREDKFFFIGPLGDNISSFYTLKDSELAVPDLKTAQGVKAIATTTDWFTEQYLKEQGFTNLVSKPDPKDDIRMLTDKVADLSVFTDVTYPQIAKDAGIDPAALKPVLELMKTEYYIAISKQTDPKTVGRWREAFAKLQRDGSLKAIKDKWFPAE